MSGYPPNQYGGGGDYYGQQGQGYPPQQGGGQPQQGYGYPPDVSAPVDDKSLMLWEFAVR